MNKEMRGNQKENREYRDSVFVDLFQTSEFAEANAKELTRWLMNLDEEWDGKIIPFRLEDALYKTYKNDVSYLVNDVLLVFSEHQSTINPNMPARSLLYVGRLLESFLSDDTRFKTKLVKIPKPLFYTFYNGKQEMPLISRLSLRDSYHDTEGLLGKVDEMYKGGELDLTVTVININQYVDGKENELIKNCPVLWDYSQLCHKINDYREEGIKEPFKRAINECIRSNILKDYLESRGAEVYNMFFSEYDYNKDIAVKKAEAFEEGREEERVAYCKRKLQKGVDVNRLMQDIQDDFDIDEITAKGLIEKAQENVNV